MDLQRTLKRSITCAGIGLHSGRKVSLSLRPAPAGSGLRFRRTDLGGLEIPAHASYVGACAYATQLRSGEATVETVEHLLAALAASRIDNAVIDLNSREVPIMDGSSAPFMYLVQEAGVKTLNEPRRYLKLARSMTLARGDKHISLYPADEFRITYTIGFDHPLLRHQTRVMTVTEHSFAEDIAPARTFTFLKEVEMLRQNGLALGGSLDNAVVIGDTGVLNSSLRFDDEFVRHKILDLVGDLALVGHPVLAHAVVHRGGHALHTAMASKLLAEPDAWQLVESPEAVPAAAGTVPVPVAN
jgi:UDP-3-O-[3-hydroxymyristoyl] N-acetylglucosamine deacetylase